MTSGYRAAQQPAPVKVKVREAEDSEEEAPRQRLQHRAPQAQQTRQPAAAQALEAHPEQQAVQAAKARVTAVLDSHMLENGYLPPEPSPLVRLRTLDRLTKSLEADSGLQSQADLAGALSAVWDELKAAGEEAVDFFVAVDKALTAGPAIATRLNILLGRVDGGISKASMSFEIPAVSSTLVARMERVERFLARDWVAAGSRGVLSIHVDKEAQTTVLQIGVAEFGPMYITIPRVLRPEDVALNSIAKLLERIEPFRKLVDPMAVIDGSHQGLNFNHLFKTTRVMRAPTGNTERLASNIRKTAQRTRLEPENTVILNSAPRDVAQYRRVFPNDREARHWPAWGDEARAWTDQAAQAGFGTAQQAGEAAMLDALTRAENVIVIVAHCDGKRLFMPEPPPAGTVITADYLAEHRDRIAANSPFVYLFSCEAGSLENLENFATALLECGAAGVVASQTILGAAEGRAFLGRLLDERRGTPPIEDFWTAMKESGYHEMEVFLA